MQGRHLADAEAFIAGRAALLAAVGSLRQYLDEERVTEIMLNPDGKLWVERASEGMSLEEAEISPLEAERFLRFVAAENDKTLDAGNASVSGRLPLWGARVQGVIPPVVASPTFAIRMPPKIVFSLEQYVEHGVITEGELAALCQLIVDEKTILIAGGTGSGKTTFLNAMLGKLAELTTARPLIIEDDPEVQCLSPNKIPLRTSYDYPPRRAAYDGMRLRPDRIIFGEIRDGVALDFLKASITGHPGMATIHANSCPTALTRFCQLIGETGTVVDRESVTEAVHAVVHLTRDRSVRAGRRITGIANVQGYKPNTGWVLS